jgi:hypothetical protein
MNGTKVFIAGSRHFSKLGSDVKHRLDNIVEKGLTVIIGDANGADKAVQKYLSAKRYKKVTVYCVNGGCRNNVGNWPTRSIAPSNPQRKDFAYFATKDRAMAEEADYGLMLWDGQSRGTLTNIVDLVRREKPVVVYISTERNFHIFTDFGTMLSKIHHEALQRIGHDLQVLETTTAPTRKSYNMSLF